jgi:hypothetical protein
MFGFVKDNFIYIKCAKNGCSTYTAFLVQHGWTEINLFENNLNLSDYIIWGHITDPHARHTKGVEKYLLDNPDIDIDNPKIGKMLVSGVFDEHTYSLSMMLSSVWNQPIFWIPLDVNIIKWNLHPVEPETLNGDDLTNDFFKEHNLNLKITIQDRKNIIGNTITRNKINALKEKYSSNYNKLIKNFLEPDLILYDKTVETFRNKYA